MIRLTIHNLTLRRDEITLLDQVGIEARPGRIHLVLGRPESGKTVLARSLAGLEPDCTGEIYLDGRDIIDIPPEKRRVGLVSADPGLWPGLSAGTNVDFGLRYRGIARQDRKSRISEALGWFGVDSLKHRRVESFSPIESRRVALARALAVDPQVMIMDDPLADLAESESQALRDDIVRVHNEQRVTTVVMARDVNPWWEFADRISLLHEGRILRTGPPDEVFHRPESLEAAAFFGPCNVIEGVAEAIDPRGEVLVRTACGRLLGRVVTSPGFVPRQGEPVIVMFRPEAIALGAVSGSATAQVNRIPVRVVRSTFAGRTFRCELEAPGEIPLTATLLAGQAAGIRPETNLTALIPSELMSVASASRNPEKDMV